MHNKIRHAILERMKEKGISYADLENMTGVSRSSIQRYVAGKTYKIPYDRLFKILHTLAIDPRDFAAYASDSKTADYFLYGTDKPFRLKPGEKSKRWSIIDLEHITDPLSEEDIPYNAEERALIDSYRTLSEQGKEYIRQQFAMAERCYAGDNAVSNVEKR